MKIEQTPLYTIKNTEGLWVFATPVDDQYTGLFYSVENNNTRCIADFDDVELFEEQCRIKAETDFVQGESSFKFENINIEGKFTVERVGDILSISVEQGSMSIGRGFADD